MELTDIRLGDSVRLRNGETIVVSHKFDSYSDKDGEHEGPFVTPKGTFDAFLLSDVVEVVARNERRCRFCGEGVTATDDATDYCRGCYYTGVAHEDQRRQLLDVLRTHRKVENASVWHTGGGCFLLAVTLHDGRLITCTEGEAELPEPGEPWRLIVVSPNQEAWDEWDEERLDLREGEWTDAELVLEVNRIANGGAS